MRTFPGEEISARKQRGVDQLLKGKPRGGSISKAPIVLTFWVPVIQC